MDMTMNDMILISTDDHLMEPRNLFEGRLPARFRGREPRYHERNGVGYWELEGKKSAIGNNGTVAGRPPTEYGFDALTYADIRKACYDVHARIDDMNLNGQLGSMVYGQYMGHGGGTIREGKDKELMLAICQAYNDWFVDEWCGAYPGRFIPMGFMPVWSVDLCVKEVRRLLAKGSHVINMPAAPNRAGLPSLHDPVWNPLWKICDDNGIAVAMHIGDTSGAPPAGDAPWEVWAMILPISLFHICSDLIWSPILRTFKNIRFIMAEGGAGWVPNFLERLDFIYKHHHFWTNQSFGNELPSEVARRGILHSIIDDDVGIANRHKIGVESMAWEGDYPHSDSVWPRGPEVLWSRLAKHDVPKAEIDQITHLNTMKACQFDPFKYMKREQATVGALRAEAAARKVSPGYVFDHDHPDMSILPKHDPNRPPITVGEFEEGMRRNVAQAMAG